MVCSHRQLCVSFLTANRAHVFSLQYQVSVNLCTLCVAFNGSVSFSLGTAGCLTMIQPPRECERVYVYVCMCTCDCVYITKTVSQSHSHFVCVCANMHVCVCIHVCAYMHVCVHVCAHKSRKYLLKRDCPTEYVHYSHLTVLTHRANLPAVERDVCVFFLSNKNFRNQGERARGSTPDNSPHCSDVQVRFGVCCQCSVISSVCERVWCVAGSTFL